MPMYNLIEYNDHYSKTSGTSWKYCRDYPDSATLGDFINFNTNNAGSSSVKIKKDKQVKQTTTTQKMLK